MTAIRSEYDVAIIGAGIAGSSLALILAKQGLSVCVVEKGKHPRFVIGESTVPSTSYGFEYLGTKYDIPEFSAIYHYTGLKKANVTGWPKQHFWFGYNELGKPLAPQNEASLFTFLPPRGPDVHTLRADLDLYFINAFPKYGIDYFDDTTVTDFEAKPDIAVLSTEHRDGSRKMIRAQYVVDASGHASFLAKKFNLRVDEPPMSTNTRSIFSHYKNVKFLDDFLPANEEMGIIRDGGTMHHCFDGGWIWSIRFDNEVTSIGITLDRERWPLDESITPEEEVSQIINRYPTVKQVLGEAVAIRPVIRTGRKHGGTDRIQFSAKSIVGDRYILAPHAAGFCDPLFSTGILLTQAFMARFVPRAMAAKADGNWSAERFQPLEPIFFRELAGIDKIVGGMFRAWKDESPEVFAHYWRLWIYTGIIMYMCRVSVPQEDCEIGLYGAGVPTAEKLIDRMNAVVFDKSLSKMEKCKVLKAIMEESWGPFPVEWPLIPDKPIVVRWRNGENDRSNAQLQLLSWWRKLIKENPPLAAKVEHSRYAEWFWETRRRAKEHEVEQESSRAENGPFHRAYEVFKALKVRSVKGPLSGNDAFHWGAK